MRYLSAGLLLIAPTAMFACTSNALAGPITYNIVPVSLSNDYMVEGGYITTNGTIGELSETDILDYGVPISGPRPFVFSPSNPGAQVQAWYELIATPRNLIVSPAILSSRLVLESKDTTQGCDTCTLQVIWRNWRYRHIRESDVRYAEVDADQPYSVLASFSYGPTINMVIATIPEPSAIVLFLLGLCFTGFTAKRNSICSRA